MSQSEKQLLKEGLELLDDALARIMECKNDEIKALSNILHGALVFGDILYAAQVFGEKINGE